MRNQQQSLQNRSRFYETKVEGAVSMLELIERTSFTTIQKDERRTTSQQS
jgi:hypothetical protein